MKCEARKATGARCGADAMRGSRRCFWHSRATASAAREARRRGGQARALALAPGAIVPARRVEILPSEGQQERPELPAWWDLRNREDVVAAVRDVGRAVVAKTLDPRAANAALQAWQILLAEKERHRAEKWARRRHARGDLRDWLEQLKSDVRDVKTSADVARLENLVEHIERLHAQARGNK